MKILLRLSLLIPLFWAVTGCNSLNYYAQTVNGGLQVLLKRKPIDKVLQDPAVDAEVKESLRQILVMRDFAVREIALPDNDSYRSYTDLQRDYVVWNVVATEELSIEARRWCFFIVGCFSYKGHFSEQQAQSLAQELTAKGLDTYVYGVDAYSTLGWFDDPVLNTMLKRTDTRMARLIFHELAHQKVFVRNDSAFNEAFASTVERFATERWLEAGHGGTVDEFRAALQREDEFIDLLLQTRAKLETLYASGGAQQELRATKQQIFSELIEGHRSLKQHWQCDKCYNTWFDKDLNNARLALVATYRHWIPAFEAVLRQERGDIKKFYQRVKEIADLPQSERYQRLQALLPARAS